MDNKPISHLEFMKRLKERQPDVYDKYKIIGQYQSNHTKIEVECRDCGHITTKSPAKLLSGRSCNNCRRLGKDVILQKLYEIRPLYKFEVDENCTVHDYCKVTCEVDHKYEAKIRKLLEGSGCKLCHFDSLKGVDNFHNHVSTNLNGVSVLGEYVNAYTKIEMSCEIHGTFENTPTAILSKKLGCPVCNYKKNFMYNKVDPNKLKEVLEEHSSGVYLLCIENVGYKFGITKDITSRVFKISKSVEEVVQVLLYVPMNLYLAIKTERGVLDYFGRNHLDIKFDGYTEMINFKPDQIDILMGIINNAA